MLYRFCCLVLAGSNWTRKAQHLLSFFLLVFGVAVSLMTTAIYEMVRSPHGSFILELCSARTTLYSQILNDYIGYKKAYNDGIFAHISGILIKQFELAIYVIMFRQLENFVHFSFERRFFCQTIT